MKTNVFFKFFIFLAFAVNYTYAQEDLITVHKKNVDYKFVRVNEVIDNFTQNEFINWNNEAFDIFAKFKNKEAIAIDLGAWIGPTSIWLSKNFYHVVSVEADKFYLDCLKKNLIASECHNISFCERPISNIVQSVTQDSTEKNLDVHENHEIIKTLTFKELVFDYIYSIRKLSDRKISFIRCDLGGNEENIIEDLLYFAYYNRCAVYISFYADMWKTKKIHNFEYLFNFFNTNCSDNNISKYIENQPNTSILFVPKRKAGILIKKNMPAVIIGYNQYTFISNMVKQLEKYTSDIIVIDNNSKFQPLLDYYEKEYKYTLLRQPKNFGFKVYERPSIQNLVGDLYLLTDPDLLFNPKLPDHFIKDMIKISNHFKSSRVGFALCIDSDNLRTDLKYHGRSIKSWESQFWKFRVYHPKMPKIPMYRAAIDTTFCLINKRHTNFSIRVAGNYTCFHIPWHKNFRDDFVEGEYESYLIDNNSTNWFK